MRLPHNYYLGPLRGRKVEEKLGAIEQFRVERLMMDVVPQQRICILMKSTRYSNNINPILPSPAIPLYRWRHTEM
jgi:hypothetical protein